MKKKRKNIINSSDDKNLNLLKKIVPSSAQLQAEEEINENAGVPFFFKQWGDVKKTHHYRVLLEIADYCRYEKKGGRLLDGREHNGTINWR